MNTVSDVKIGQTTVGTTAVRVVVSLPDNNKKGVLVKAHGANDAASNTVPVFVGLNDQVTSSDGFSLAPGESVVVPYYEEVWAISTSAGQVVSFIEA